MFKLLKSHGLPDRVIENMMGWHHSGFNVYCGPAIWPSNNTGIENLARYIIRAAFSQERMTYIPAATASDGRAKVIYQSKNGRDRKVFEALDWLAQLTTHIPNRREHMVRYYGYYSNKSRGQRKKADQDDDIASIIESDLSNKAFRKSWARLIQKESGRILNMFWGFLVRGSVKLERNIGRMLKREFPWKDVLSW